ncbi:GPR1/FUN34/YaaH-class plasma membrane protein [Acrodontium crateriforme]|uniref:GPR1/FUN34/YaaH-class plasma membrane protein n=1 Tax=Acrodontium crateriforme TaxID=150365 RepID=A0AAQ3RDE7_9PEZI|nr:GPR1/FUN34/YaaH-class plasma membrane protein [Acrodontium crateriforme]
MSDSSAPIDFKPHTSQDELAANSLRPVMTIDPAVFEKLYLAPKGDTQGNLRKVLANPTPVAVMGFIVALTPLSCELMGWKGAAGNGVATGTASLFFGGMLLIIAGILEFILGNTFPFGKNTTLPPFLSIIRSLTYPISRVHGLRLAFLDICVLSFVFLLCSIRTNVIFVLVFALATTGFGCGAGAFWHLGGGNTALGNKLLVAAGACFFGAAMLGWYLFLAIMLASMDLPSPPVFDLSNVIKGVSQRQAIKEAKAREHSD